MKKEKKERLLPRRIRTTLLIMFVYMLCRRITLYGADLNYYIHQTVDAEYMLAQTIGGDIRKISVFALGITPYIISSMIVMIVTAIIRANSKSKISMKKVNAVMITGTLIVAVIQAIIFINGMYYYVDPEKLVLANITSGTELVAGAMLISWLISRNKKFGIGQQTALIMVNIQETIFATVTQYSFAELRVPMLWGAFGMVIMLIMENTEFRVPVQRVSIHNVYSDKNYQAFKLNPVGPMPVMFAMGAFALLQLLLGLLQLLLQDFVSLEGAVEAMELTNPVGIAVFIFVIYVLNYVFSLITINPSEMAENFLKSGDCLSNLRSGADTKRYLKRTVWNLSFFSSTVLSLFIGIPLALQSGSGQDSALRMLPTSMMLMIGLYVNIYREIDTLRSFDSYKTFL